MTPAKPCLWIIALVAVLAVPGLAAAQTCTNVGDCGQGMVCHSQNTTSCSGGTAVAVPCAPNTVCPTPPPASDPVCTETTVSLCVYTWQLPCNADGDCGDGFVCQPTTTGACSGSAPVSDGGPAPTPVCVTTQSFPGSCQAKVTSCTSDADCPSVWTCVVSTLTTVSSGPIAMDAGAATTLTPPTTAPPTTSKACQAPNAYTGHPDGTESAQPTLNGGSPSDGGATTKGTTTPPTTVQPGGGTSTDTKTSATLTRDGCALGGGAAPGRLVDLLGLLGLLGAVGVRRLRRGR